RVENRRLSNEPGYEIGIEVVATRFLLDSRPPVERIEHLPHFAGHLFRQRLSVIRIRPSQCIDRRSTFIARTEYLCHAQTQERGVRRSLAQRLQLVHRGLQERESHQLFGLVYSYHTRAVERL